MTTSPFMPIKEAAQFFCTSESSIRQSLELYARLSHVRINGRVYIVRESAEKLAADVLKCGKLVDGVVVEMARRRA